MALRGTLTHRKTRRLGQLLSIPPTFALGVLESLWHVAAEQTPDGAIGRLSDQDIADEMFFDGDAGALIAALVDAGWLDRDDKHRLIVHDWHDHADQSVKRKVARHGNGFVSHDNTVTSHDESRIVTPSSPVPVPEPESSSSPSDNEPPVVEGVELSVVVAEPEPVAEIPATARPPSEPWRSISACLNRVAELLDIPPPTDAQIKPHLKETSHLRQLMAKHGVETTAQMFVYASQHFRQRVTWTIVWNAEADVLAKMKQPQLNGKSTSGMHQSARAMLEAMDAS